MNLSVARHANSQPIVELRDVSVALRTSHGSTPILVGLNLKLRRGEIVGLVGESGSGKSMTARTILKALPQGALVTGDVLFEGEPIPDSGRRLRDVRSRRVAMIFQDPRAYVDPLYRVGDYITEGIRALGTHSRKAATARAVDLLAQVGIRDGQRRLSQYPGELSGGMLQRVAIAGALAGDPALLIADEATTALDVTTQAEIVDVLTRLRDQRGLGVLFITHDLALASQICDRVCVMYAGRIVEEQSAGGVFEDPRHPYTRALLASRPVLEGRAVGRLPVIPGRPTSAAAAPPGCPFSGRCAFASETSGCTTVDPPLSAVDGVLAACHRVQYVREQLSARSSG